MTMAKQPQPAPVALSFDAAMFRKLFPDEYASRCLANGVRPDARAPLAARAVHVQPRAVQSAASASLVKLGRTSVLAAVKLAVGLPAVSTPDQGEVAIQVHLTPLCSKRFGLGRPSEEAQSIGSQLTSILVGSRVVEMSDLSIEKGRSAWKLLVDVLCIDHDGNVLDAALAAIMAALKTLKLPAVSVNEADHVVSIQPDEEAVALPLQHSAFATSFAVVDDVVLLDPTSQEEELASATFSITYSSKGLLCGVQKPGGAALSPQQLHECMGVAKQRAQALAKQVDAAAAHA
ncbi:hypothetical protein PybrP1_008609 [[Pythium] brassicae (nom. inval.)]|nr:hypothetical protein PybrP1_008609 [[Pythium] brassicae (nom. inval.)]